MKQVKDWAYLLFRPKWERWLYKLLRKASCDKYLRLDTVLYDYCRPTEMEGKIFKAGVDAMFIGWIGIFDAKFSSKKQFCPSIHGVSRQEVLCNQTLKEYLKAMADYIASDKVSAADRHFLKELAHDDFLGLRQCWFNRQKAAKELVSKISENGAFFVRCLYEPNFGGVQSGLVDNIKTGLRSSLKIKASRVETSRDIPNWATLVAYYCSVS